MPNEANAQGYVAVAEPVGSEADDRGLPSGGTPDPNGKAHDKESARVRDAPDKNSNSS